MTSSIEQQVALLSHELEASKARFKRWLIACCVFATGVSLLAAVTKSVFFLVVAGFGWFFVWNRWKCWTFVCAIASKPSLSNDEERTRWANAVTEAVLHQPSWWLYSEYISGMTLIALFAVVTFFVVGDSGWLMRALYAITWGVFLLSIFWRAKDARTRRRTHHAG